MPYPFVLPTTSAFSFSAAFASDSHPSLPLSASTYRGVVRDALKKHKRLPPSSQTSNLTVVVAAVEGYLPYLLAVDAGLAGQPVGTHTVGVTSKSPLRIDWRPTLSGEVVPGRERTRIKIASLEHEVFFVLSTLGFAHVATARACLQPLHSTTGEILSAQQRTAAITAASKALLDTASIYDYLARRSEQPSSSAPPGPPPCVDVSPSIARALSSLALAEATLLAILKDDPYPAVVAQDRNINDTEWMYKAPDIPKVRAHLCARLALAASEHAAKAVALCQGSAAAPGVNSRVSGHLVRYMEDLRRTSRAKACRFFGIDAELGGEVADGIGWARAGLQELGVDISDKGKRSSGGGLGLSKLKKGFKERREDKRVDGDGSAWGADAGRLEETRILELLDAKWSKVNDTVSVEVGFDFCYEANVGLDEYQNGTAAECAADQDAVWPRYSLYKAICAAVSRPGCIRRHACASRAGRRPRRRPELRWRRRCSERARCVSRICGIRRRPSDRKLVLLSTDLKFHDGYHDDLYNRIKECSIIYRHLMPGPCKVKERYPTAISLFFIHNTMPTQTATFAAVWYYTHLLSRRSLGAGARDKRSRRGADGLGKGRPGLAVGDTSTSVSVYFSLQTSKLRVSTYPPYHMPHSLTRSTQTVRVLQLSTLEVGVAVEVVGGGGGGVVAVPVLVGGLQAPPPPPVSVLVVVVLSRLHGGGEGVGPVQGL